MALIRLYPAGVSLHSFSYTISFVQNFTVFSLSVPGFQIPLIYLSFDYRSFQPKYFPTNQNKNLIKSTIKWNNDLKTSDYQFQH